jgi:hypothetical protein
MHITSPTASPTPADLGNLEITRIGNALSSEIGKLARAAASWIPDPVPYVIPALGAYAAIRFVAATLTFARRSDLAHQVSRPVFPWRSRGEFAQNDLLEKLGQASLYELFTSRLPQEGIAYLTNPANTNLLNKPHDYVLWIMGSAYDVSNPALKWLNSLHY